MHKHILKYQAQNTSAMGLLKLETVKQLSLATVASLGHLTIGLSRGWSATALPSIVISRPDIVSSPEQESWAASVMAVGALTGSLLAGPLLHQTGRKRTLQIVSPLYICGWLLIGFTQTFPILLFGRFIAGLGIAISFPAAQIYISECSKPRIRGLLGSFPPLFLSGGVLLSYVLGMWLPWNDLSLATALIPLMLFLLIWPFPESPSWLLLKGQKSRAEASVKWFYEDNQQDVAVEMEPMNPEKEAKNNISTCETPRQKHFLSGYLDRSVLRPFATAGALFVFQQLTGIDTIIFYAVSIFETAQIDIDHNMAAVIIGLVQLLAIFLSFFLIDKLGRKPLLYISGFLSAASMAALGTFFYYDRHNASQNIQSLPIISLCVFMIGFSIGLGSVPNVIFGEILPEKQRSSLSGLTGILHFGTLFLIVKTYSNIKKAIGNEGVFWIYSACSFLSCIFVWFFVPETKGKTLREIENYFKKPTKL